MDGKYETIEQGGVEEWVPGEPDGDPIEEAEAFFGAGVMADPDDGNGRRAPVGGRQKRQARGRRLVKKETTPKREFTPGQRLLILDTWQRSGLAAGDFAPLVGVSPNTLYQWKKAFEKWGPEGLDKKKRSVPKTSKLPEVTRRTILMLKESNPEFGCQRISDMLYRSEGLEASAGTVNKVLKDAGYEFEEVVTSPHRPVKRRFGRLTPNKMWQTDLFTFVLPRQNRRAYLVAFMDDHSRFVVSFGLWASASTKLVIETFRSGIANYGQPEEVLTDNGPQYVTWRGKSEFAKELEKLGIRHLVARPKHPQTLGKVERMWGSLWRECVQKSIFFDLKDAQARIAQYFDYYNFHRPHQGLDSLAPADLYFNAAPEVKEALRKRVAENALQLAREGIPKKPFYLTGKIGDKSVSVHAAGDRTIMTPEGGSSEEVELIEGEGAQMLVPDPAFVAVTPAANLGGLDVPGNEEPAAPGISHLDEGLDRIAESLEETDIEELEEDFEEEDSEEKTSEEPGGES